MGKLMKYEFLRRKNLLIIIFIVMLVLEGAVLFGIYKNDNWLIMSVVLTMVITVGGLLMPLIDCISNHYSDYKNKHGYMMFLTPNSGYSIIGAKALTSLIILIGMVILVAGSLFASYRFAVHMYPDIKTLISNAQIDISTGLTQNISIGGAIAWLSAAALVQYMYNIMLIMLSITLAKTALPNKQFNFLFALLFYIGVSMVVETINGLAIAGAGFVGDMIKAVSADNPFLLNIGKYVIVGLVMYLIWMAASYVISSLLVSKRTDL